MLPAGIMAAIHNFGSKLTVEKYENDHDGGGGGDGDGDGSGWGTW